MKLVAMEVVEFDTDKVVRTIEIDPPIEVDSSRAERLLSGLLRNMDTERYYVREVEK